MTETKKFVNLTPHPLIIFGPGGERVEIPPSGQVARVAERREWIGEVNGIPVYRPVYGPVEGLPDPKEDTVYLVSSLVLSRVRGRDDVLAPDTGAGAVRDEKGQIIGVKALLAPPSP